MKKTSNTIGFYVPAGEYALCDPCYAVADDDWMELLGSCDYFNEPIGTIKGFKVYAFDTMYGDGSYRGTDGFTYGVDAGLIGLTPVEYMGEKELGEVFGDRPLGTKITFSVPTYCSRSEDGLLKFGDVHINTDEYDDDEDVIDEDYDF